MKQRFSTTLCLVKNILNMKKIIFTVITVLSFVSGQAQFEKGSKWIAGSASISASTSETNLNPPATDYKNNRISIGFRPSLNKFISDKVMNSLFLGYTYSGNKETNSSGYVSKSQGHTTQFGFGKTHLNPLIGKIYSTISTNFFGEYYYSKQENISNTGANVNTTISNNFSANANFGLGLIYRASDRFAITTTLNNFLYARVASNNQTYNSIGNTETTNKGFSIDGGFGLAGFNFSNLQFGLMYRLHSKK